MSEPPLPHLVGITNAREKRIVKHAALWQASLCFFLFVLEAGLLGVLWWLVQKRGYSPAFGKSAALVGFLAVGALGAGVWFLRKWLRQQKTAQ